MATRITGDRDRCCHLPVEDGRSPEEGRRLKSTGWRYYAHVVAEMHFHAWKNPRKQFKYERFFLYLKNIKQCPEQSEN